VGSEAAEVVRSEEEMSNDNQISRLDPEWLGQDRKATVHW
jgi:hypothetical protein